ncbi:DUF6732 family protein [Algirhabdus cladophorae]|uniref:DUF6732 family protein n=1 Tax=Algirhabdus cladophorae TaxID=3377108 RepID=UPI003B84A1C3
MKSLSIFIASLWTMFGTGAAVAHPGHLIEVAGHDHVLAGVAIGAAIAAGLWGALKGKPKTEEAVEEDAIEEEPQEA